MQIRYSLCSFALLLMLMVVSTKLAGAADEPKKVEHTSAAPTSPASGHDMFMSYCASCHGKTAKGNGPAASALKVAPADLTVLAKDNAGKYPTNKVTAILSGKTDLVAHGNREMPVWGEVFWRMSGGHEGEVQQRIANLNRYIESLQAK